MSRISLGSSRGLVTSMGVAYTTTAGDKTVTATPAIGYLIVVCHAVSGVTTNTIADNQSGTYTKIASVGTINSGQTAISVRNQIVTAATSTIYTATQTSSTGGGLSVFGIRDAAHRALTGSAAVRNSGANGGAAAATPTVTYAASGSMVGTSIIIGCVTNVSTTTITAPTSTMSGVAYAKPTANNHTVPNSQFDCVRADEGGSIGGDTGTTVTWGATSTGAWDAVVVELFGTPFQSVTLAEIQPAEYGAIGSTSVGV